jgi:hypothetical protein
MLIFLTFSVFVFLHGFEMKSTIVLGFLTRFLKIRGKYVSFSILSKKKIHPLYLEDGPFRKPN